MSWRTVVISGRCKLDYKMGFLVVRGEQIKKVYADEISMLIVEDPAVSLTAYLINELIARKVKVIFCDVKRNPSAELVSLYGSHDTSAKVRRQAAWTNEVKGLIWTEIISEKIRNQARLLTAVGREDSAQLLRSYLVQLEFYDATNREGHAAKVYFNSLFGSSFSRSAEISINAALNYGYGILLSAINREIVANGYLTQLGLFHDNMFNQFNLGCDLMEPYRVFIDHAVYKLQVQEFTTEEKRRILACFNGTVTLEGNKQTVMNSVKIYVKSVFDAISDMDVAKLKFPKFDYEL